ncbi:TonB-dependent receptor [Thermophagus sp. OGC60D27]|uniref:TonB-dependent receptor n=1 Tax=Thermophagus sp. OGC60D27 TaxID=3458415 RepID=UPI0040381136
MKSVNIIILFFTLFVFGVNGLAQESLTKDVRVQREYVPTVFDAMKINQMPEREDTIDFNPRFGYQLSVHPLSGIPEVSPLKAAALARQHPRDLYSSYVRGGLGNYQLLFGDIFYNITRNEKFAFSIGLQQESSWGDLKLENDRSVDAPYHNTNGGLYMRHFFDDKTLELDLDFHRLAYRYYGFQTIDPAAVYNVFLGDGTSQDVVGANLIPDDKQRQTAFDLHFGLHGQQSDLNDTRYHLNFDYGGFNNRTGVGENSFSLGGDLYIPFGALSLKVDGAGIYRKTNVPEEDENPELFDFEERDQVFLTVNPKVVFPGNKLKVEVGLNLTGEFSDSEKFYLSPHVRGDLIIAEGVVSTFLGMTGQVHQNSYRDIMEENPFVSPDVLVQPSFTNIRGFAGVKGNFSSATSFTARLDYEFIEDEYFFVNRFFLRDESVDDWAMSNLFDVQYDDATLLTLTGEFLIRPVQELDIILKGVYYGWTLDNFDYAWHKPEMELGIRAGYTFNEEWRFDASFNVIGERKALNSLQDGDIKNLSSVADFNLSANYQFNKRLHFFGRIQNIFASKFYPWAGYPMQGFNARVGAGYSF